MDELYKQALIKAAKLKKQGFHVTIRDMSASGYIDVIATFTYWQKGEQDGE